MKVSAAKLWTVLLLYYDTVKHDKLAEVMEKAGIPELERRLIINLYWRQHVAGRWDGEVGREVYEMEINV